MPGGPAVAVLRPAAGAVAQACVRLPGGAQVLQVAARADPRDARPLRGLASPTGRRRSACSAFTTSAPSSRSAPSAARRHPAGARRRTRRSTSSCASSPGAVHLARAPRRTGATARRSREGERLDQVAARRRRAAPPRTVSTSRAAVTTTTSTRAAALAAQVAQHVEAGGRAGRRRAARGPAAAGGRPRRLAAGVHLADDAEALEPLDVAAVDAGHHEVVVDDEDVDHGAGHRVVRAAAR